MKKLMLLGGLGYLIPVIDAAHREGYHVITCDYIPDNIAHRYSDEYHNVSIVEKDKVLGLARTLDIDGIMSFAVDPGVVTAAYVQEKMGLPGNPYDSVCILQDKSRFRKFLKDNGFNVPAAISACNIEEAMEKISGLNFPVIVKPVDSAGSKGVTKIENPEDLPPAFDHAMEYSICGKVIVEEFIEKEGCSSDSDCFSVDGKLVFTSFSAQRFDISAPNPYTPAAYSWPSTMPEATEKELEAEIQRLISLLGMKTSVYNIETRLGTDGKAYIMEVSPRGGGNRLSEMLRLSTGTDLIAAAVRSAVGDDPGHIKPCSYKGHWAEIILHSDKSGIYRKIEISHEMQGHVVTTDLLVKPGDPVRKFNGANDCIGTMALKFDTEESLEAALSDMSWIKTIVE